MCLDIKEAKKSAARAEPTGKVIVVKKNRPQGPNLLALFEVRTKVLLDVSIDGLPACISNSAIHMLLYLLRPSLGDPKFIASRPQRDD